MESMATFRGRGSALRQQGYCKIRAPELEQSELVVETARKLAGAWCFVVFEQRDGADGCGKSTHHNDDDWKFCRKK